MRKLPAHFAAGLVPVSMPESRLMPHPPCLRLLLLALLSLSSLLLLPLRASAVEGSAGIDLTLRQDLLAPFVATDDRVSHRALVPL